MLDLEKGETEIDRRFAKEESPSFLCPWGSHSILYIAGPLSPSVSHQNNLFTSAPIPRLSSLKVQAAYYSHLLRT